MYTVEQIRKAGEISSIDVEHLIAVLNSGKPLVSGSLPSDEKLKKLAYEEIPYNDDKRAWWMRGAQFVRDLLGGNDL